MQYTKVTLDAIGYELPPVVVTTAELEERLAPLYDALRIPRGQIEAMTGIHERRWWTPDYPVSRGAAEAAKRAMARAGLRPEDVDALIYTGVCREHFEPATACHVAAEVGVGAGAMIYDISNACLGMLNGIVDLANRIELGQIRAGIAVTCETSREINEVMIERMLREGTMEAFTKSLTTLTGGSGAVAIVLTDGSFSEEHRPRVLGGAARSEPRFHNLCLWGLERIREIDAKLPRVVRPFMSTDSASVLKYGVDLGRRTWQAFLKNVGWGVEQVDKVICHQVGSGHRQTILSVLGLAPEKDFSTYEYLGNIGTVSLPLTVALAAERGFLRPGDRVGFLGIGSGLNCMMLGLEW